MSDFSRHHDQLADLVSRCQSKPEYSELEEWNLFPQQRGLVHSQVALSCKNQHNRQWYATEGTVLGSCQIGEAHITSDQIQSYTWRFGLLAPELGYTERLPTCLRFSQVYNGDPT
jgi:hypothetical protein